MAYAVRLSVFEGPLHLLLHLIRSRKLEISDIPIASITEQYLEYLHLMEELDLEVAGEFVVMAATLMEIKSRMLLPRSPKPEDAEEGPDPRQELVDRLLDYERYQQVAAELRAKEEAARLEFARPPVEAEETAAPLVRMAPNDLLSALRRLLAETGEENGKSAPRVKVKREGINFQRRVQEVWEQVRAGADGGPVSFLSLLPTRLTRRGVIVTFLAVLELVRQGRIAAWQQDALGDIMLTPIAEDPAPT